MRKGNLMMAVFTALALTACGSSSSTAPQQPVSVSERGDTDSTSATAETAKAEKETTEAETKKDSSKDISIKEQEIYNQDGVTVSVTGFNMNGSYGPSVKLLVENNSEKNITIQPRNSSVNGYMIDLQMSCDVSSGKKANDSLDMFSSTLKECGIETITDIEFSLHIFESGTYESITDSDQIILKTSAADTYTQKYDDSGEVLYDKNNIRIISKGLLTDDSSIFGPEFIVYIENNSDKSITVQVRDTSINGFMVDPSMSTEVAPGKKAVDNMTFLSSQLEENKITQIDEIETSFHIFDTKGYESIDDSDPLVISFK